MIATGCPVRRDTRIDQAVLRVRGQKRHDHGVILLRLAGAGGVNQPAARRNRFRRVTEHRRFGGGERRQIGLAAAPANVGIAPQRAEPRAWRVDKHRVERPREGERVQQIGLNDAHVRRSGGRDRLTQQLDPPVSDVAGNEQARVAHRCGESSGLTGAETSGKSLEGVHA